MKIFHSSRVKGESRHTKGAAEARRAEAAQLWLLGGRGYYSSSNTNPKGKSLFAEGEMSFGVASCSDLLQKGQKSDEYEVFVLLWHKAGSERRRRKTAESWLKSEHRNRWVDGEDSASPPMAFLL